jgi:tRNA(Ile)-lysidine synthase
VAQTDIVDRTRGRPLLVGFSGGMDSTVLLHLLHGNPGTRGRLRAIHVDHGLHPDAARWSAHCQAACAALGVPLLRVGVRVDAAAGHGPEGAARIARHAAFQAELHDDEVLVLAHHRDDQAETFLLRALRASGPDGLGAMRPWRRFGRGWLWRPLLDVPRAELRAHADRAALQWIEDPGNANDAIDRNFLRNQVLPLLRRRWPNADAAFARSATLSAEASGLLADEDARALARVRTQDPRMLDVTLLRAVPSARRARVLRHWIDTLGLPSLPAQGVAAIEASLLHGASDRVCAFAWSGAVVRRWRDVLHADRRRDPLPADWQAPWDGRAELPLPDGASLRLQGCVGFDRPVLVGARRGGERIRLAGRSHSHALKHVLQELGVPPWQRARLPLVCSVEGDVLAVGDRVRSAAFDAWLRERDARLAWSESSCD